MAENLASKLGIQSYCFRGFPKAEQIIEGLKACGVDKLEICGVHWKPAEQPDPRVVVEEYRKGGITLSSFGVQAIGDDEKAARPAFELAKAAGFPVISADVRGANGLAVAEKLCKEYVKKIAIHNHGRKHRLGPAWALEELFAKASMNVGLCLDTAWALDSGDDPLAVAQKFKDRLYGLHLKDFVFDRAGKHQDVVVGTGNLNLQGMADFLKSINFGGYLTLEYEGDVNNPTPALKKCCEAIRKAFA
mgnify:CR=1 FL=1